jgi:hypothetical protein
MWNLKPNAEPRSAQYAGPKPLERQMINRVPALVAAGVLAASLAGSMSVGSATPLTGALVVDHAPSRPVEAVRWAAGGRGGFAVGGVRGGYARGPVAGPGWRGPGGGGPGYGYGRPGWGGGWGYGVGAAVVGGAIIGGALAAPYYGYGPYYPAPYPYYAEPVYEDTPPPGAYARPPDVGGYGAPPAGGGDPGYCAQRFGSYDPQSGTYLGTDGLRHPCP